MIKYWTTWNFVWFIGSKNGYFQINNALRISIVTTSILGGYMAYIYPRKMILHIRDYRYNLPYPLLLTGDLIFHQLPLIYILHSDNTENTCAAKVILPIYCWSSYNMVKRKNLDKIYGIRMSYLYATSALILGTSGLLYHNYGINLNNVLKSLPCLMKSK